MAMVTGCPFEVVLEECGVAPLTDRDLAIALARHRVATGWNQPWSPVMISVVPSLRLTGRLHYIVLDYRDGEPQVFDPAIERQWTHDMVLERGSAYYISCFDVSTPTLTG